MFRRSLVLVVVLVMTAAGCGAAGGPSPAVSAPSLAPSAPLPSTKPSVKPAATPNVGRLPVGRMVFARLDHDPEGRFQGLFILGADGVESAVELPAAADFATAVWSPDGKRLVLNTYSEATGPAVGILELATGIYAPLRHEGVDDGLECSDWTPGGTSVICALGSNGDAPDGLYLVDIAKGSAVRLTKSPYHTAEGSEGGCGGGESRAVYSPDGTQFAYEQQRCGTGPNPASDEMGDIVVANADGSGQEVIVPLGGVRTHPGGEISWSPVDDRIAFATQDGILSIVRADGSDLRRVPVAESGYLYGPAWSPDGKWILATLYVGSTDRQDLYAIAADGSTVVRLTDTRSAEAFTDWGL